MTTCTLAALAFGSTAFAQGNDDSRVFVVFKDGHKGAVQRTLNGNGAKFHYSFDDLNTFAVSVPQQAVKGLRNNPHVVRVEKDVKRFPLAQTQPYGIGMVEADLVSDSNAGNRTICIIDSGYDINHEDLSSGGNITGSNDPGGSGNWYEDGNGHGTHVAGTIAALNNSLGVVGVMGNDNINLHIVKVFDASGWAYSSSLVDAAKTCESNGANLISMSLGGGSPSGTEDNYFTNANGRGVLSIAAAGNDGSTQKSYPASYDAVVSVAAVDQTKTVASFSQQNDQVELSGPGVGVKSTVPMGTGSNTELSVDSVGYEAIAMEGSPDATGTGPLVDCGIGDSTCTGAKDAVCLIQRGSISFADKVLACEDGGGVGAVIYNNESGSLNGTLGSTTTTIPSVGITKTDGEYLLNNKLGASSTVTTGPGNYAFFDGTSMATPHVSGVAALVWSHHSSCTNDEIRNVLATTAEDLGSAGRDNAYGYGLVRTKAAVDYITNNGCAGDGGSTNEAPTASFTYSCTDLACDFDGSGSSDSDGSIASYDWDFGDGATATGSTASHTYGSGGDYSVTLTVTDDAGATDTSAQTVSVSDSTSNTAPTASFTYACTDLACDFDGSGSSDSDGSIASYDWDFGDGATATGSLASHTYGAGGDYSVTLTVTDDAGATDTSTQTVSVTSGDTGDSITLDTTAYKVRGRHHIDLSWGGATSTNVDIYLNGSLSTTTANDGAYTHSTNNRGKGTYTFEVCEAGTSTCSPSSTASY